MPPEKETMIGFAVIKLNFDGIQFYLMRRNDKWKDFNFIGGHANERDRGSLQHAANREFREEVPSSRYLKYSLRHLTPALRFGPHYSRSARALVLYHVQFFLVAISDDPTEMVNNISHKSKNRLVAQDQLAKPSRAITKFATFLDEHVEGGLDNIPFSWTEELPAASRYAGIWDSSQLDLTFR